MTINRNWQKEYCANEKDDAQQTNFFQPTRILTIIKMCRNVCTHVPCVPEHIKMRSDGPFCAGVHRITEVHIELAFAHTFSTFINYNVPKHLTGLLKLSPYFYGIFYDLLHKNISYTCKYGFLSVLTPKAFKGC